MRAVDTNVLVRLLIGDDPPQVIAAERFVKAGAWVSHVTLAEASWVLESNYGRNRPQIGAAFELLLDQETLTLQDREVVQATLETFRSGSGVSFSDCLTLEIARKAGHTPLGTFDRKLARLDGAERIGR